MAKKGKVPEPRPERNQQGRVQLDADWNAQSKAEKAKATDEIRTGAEDGSEMGAFAHSKTPHQEDGTSDGVHLRWATKREVDKVPPKPRPKPKPEGIFEPGKEVEIKMGGKRTAKPPPKPPFWQQPRWLGSIIGGIAAVALIAAGFIWGPDLFSGVSGEDLPVIRSYTANPDSISPGSDSNLMWKVVLGSKTGTVTIDHGVGDVAAKGSQDVTPPVTTDYNLEACNENGCVNAKATVTVAQKTSYAAKDGLEVMYFTAEPKQTAKPGDAVKLKYKAMDAENVKVSEVGAADPIYSGTWLTGTVWRYPQQTTTYEVTAYKGKKTEKAEVTVWVKGSGDGESPFAGSTTESGEQTASQDLTGGGTGWNPPNSGWGTGGNTGTQVPPPVIYYFWPAPTTQVVNKTAYLYWDTLYTDKVTVLETGQTGPLSGGSCLIPSTYTSTTGLKTFTLQAEGPGGPPVTQTTQFTVTQTGGGGCDESKLAADFKVDGGADVTIDYGQSALLSWDVKPTGAAVEISGVGTGLQLNSTNQVKPTQCTTYALTATCGNKTIPLETTVHVVPIVNVTCSKTKIELGEAVTGKWVVSPATATVDISWGPPVSEPNKGGEKKGVNPSDNFDFIPDVVDNNYQFTVSAYTAGTHVHVVTKGCTIEVKKPTLTIEKFTANGSSNNTISVIKNQPVKFEWTVKGCTADTEVSFGTTGNLQPTSGTCTAGKWEGNKTLNPTANGDYTVKAVDGSEQATKTISVTVTEPVPHVQFWASKTTVTPNEAFNLCWSISPQGAATWAKIGLMGGGTVYPVSPQDGCWPASMPSAGVYTFGFQAGNDAGQDMKTVTVQVLEVKPPPPIGEDKGLRRDK